MSLTRNLPSNARASRTVARARVLAIIPAAWGGALESVDSRKRAKISAAAHYFLQQQSRWASSPCRFDVVAMSAIDSSGHGLNWIQNAFDT